MTEKKSYLIELFLKLSRQKEILEEVYKVSIDLFTNTYKNIPKDEIKKLKEKYNYNYYLSLITEIIDNNFSEEELEEINNFYSSTVGKKLTNDNYIKKIRTISDNLFIEFQSKLAILYTKNSKKTEK